VYWEELSEQLLLFHTLPAPSSKPEVGMNDKPKQLEVELGEKESEGVYSNMVLIAHSPYEFIFDFARYLPGVKKAKVYSRVIMTPQHARSLQKTLEENIKKYEKKFGKIELGGKDQTIGFKGADE
jgi:hypothetical protein